MMIAKRPMERRNHWLVGVLVLLFSACGVNEQASLAQEAEQNAVEWPRHV